MKPRHWFTPHTPDVLGMLEAQAAVTLEGVRALLAWAEGDPSAADAVRDAEHRADDCKRTLRIALTEAFLTPLEPRTSSSSRAASTTSSTARTTPSARRS